MKPALTLLMVIFFASSPMVGYSQEQPPPVPSAEVPEVMTRGPVNEAFAQPVDIENPAGLVVPTAPPADIDEIPPDEKPVGDQYTWVPGYWAWDTDSKGYIWVSGCWRAVPPNMSWVPGYWAQVPGGWQWVAGYWGPVKAEEVEYLPEPPAVTDVDPPVAPAAANQIWVPPCWYWHQTRYIQRPGYWIDGRPDWVWVPSSYVWTPHGYIFAPGHWDYTLAHRGVLFAPVYFPPRMVAHPGFSYSLSIVVDLGSLQFGLFTRPRYHHYYFGDYYDPVYLRMGIFPRFECERRRDWYDPIYVHDRWRHHRDEPRWERYERREYEQRRDHRDLRPPRTYADMQHRMKQMPPAKRNQFDFAEPVTRFAARKATPMRFERTRPDTHRQLSRHTADVRKFVDERSRRESAGQGHKAGQPMPERKSPSAFKAAPSPMKHQKPMARSPQPPVARQERHYDKGSNAKGMAPPDKRQETVKKSRPAKLAPQKSQHDRGPNPQKRGMAPPDKRQEAAKKSQPAKPASQKSQHNRGPNPQKRGMAPPDNRHETVRTPKPAPQERRHADRPNAQAPQKAPRNQHPVERPSSDKKAPAPQQHPQKGAPPDVRGGQGDRTHHQPAPEDSQKNNSGRKGSPAWPPEEHRN